MSPVTGTRRQDQRQCGRVGVPAKHSIRAKERTRDESASTGFNPPGTRVNLELRHTHEPLLLWSRDGEYRDNTF